MTQTSRRRWKDHWTKSVRAVSSVAARDLSFFPVAKIFSSYSRSSAFADAKAGLNVALLGFPQAMAYALIAGLSVSYGIFCAIVAPVVAGLFSSSRHVMVGPTNATAVMVLSALITMPQSIPRLDAVPVLCLLIGVFLVAGAIFNVAALIRYVSRTVVTGYVSGAACLIIVNQVHSALGYAVPHSATLFDALGNMAKNLPQAHWPSAAISVMTLLLWWPFATRWKKLPGVAIVIVVMSLLTWVVGLYFIEWRVECLTPVVSSLDWIQVPSLTWKSISLLASSALAVSILASLEGISVGKTLAARSGERMDSNQQMLALGLANAACAFASAMPASGSLTRSVLGVSSGAMTPLAGIWSGAVVSVITISLGWTIGFIPKPVLATLVIIVGFSLFNRKQIQFSLKSTKSDAATFVVTFIASLLFPLDVAVYMGVGFSIVLFLRKVATPELLEYTFNDEGNLCAMEHKQERMDPHISIVHVEGELFFGAAEIFREEIGRVCADPNLKVVILRMKNAHHLDATSVMALEELVRFLRDNNRHLIVSGAQLDILRVLKNSGLLDILGKENIFAASPKNPNLATRAALKRAQELLGGVHPEVRIFYDPKKSAVTTATTGAAAQVTTP